MTCTVGSQGERERERYKATSEEMQIHFLHSSLEEHQLGTSHLPVFVFSMKGCSQRLLAGCRTALGVLETRTKSCQTGRRGKASVKQPRISLLQKKVMTSMPGF